VFTGLSWGTGDTNLWWEFYWPEVYRPDRPPAMWQEFHDTNTKVLVRGQVLPANQSGMKDVDDAMNNLANHPNVGPFLGRRLIQRFRHLQPQHRLHRTRRRRLQQQRQRVRGDLKAVLQALLLDPERAIPAACRTRPSANSANPTCGWSTWAAPSTRYRPTASTKCGGWTKCTPCSP
jgi:uncharacterized protein (DUF1800 family)